MFTQHRFTELGTEKESEELGYETKKKREMEGRERRREGRKETTKRAITALHDKKQKGWLK